MTSCMENKKSAEDTSSNPLLSEFKTPFGVPPFELIKPEHYMPAFIEAMKQDSVEIESIINNNEEPTFTNTIEALDKSGQLLARVGAIFFSQSGANTNEELQKIAEQVSPMLAAHSDNINLNPKLFQRIKSVYENQANFKLTKEQAFILENKYKSLVRNGANLDEKKQTRLKELNQQLSSLGVKFDQNLLKETNGFKLVIDKKEDLAGLSDDIIAGAADMAKSLGMEDKWVFTTQKPSMLPFLQYAQNRALREKLYMAYTSRGNNNNAQDNKKVLADIMKLRSERANLLGYKSHAALNLEARMAKNPENAMKLLNQLWEKALPIAKREAQELQKIIDKEGGKFKLASWDWWYYAEKLRKEKYNLDDNELRPYFKLENVRDGAFATATKLYGITFTAIKDIPLPHPEAQAFEVKEADGSPVGVLYMDFYPRESKQQGAWCGAYRDHSVLDGKQINPIITVVCNFTKPTAGKPSLLSIDEVETLFHEFGHALEGLFAQNTYNMKYVAQDFVELPSQIMEHWATENEVLAMYAKQYETGEVIPAKLVEKIKNSGYFNQGFNNVEYLAASMLDMEYHSMEKPTDLDVEKFEKDYLSKIGLISEIVSRYRSTYFAHIIGGYDAGYYSYIWAAVLDNDGFEAFKETGIFNKETAASFRKNILAKDGTIDAMEMFTSFRGREPKIEPLLKNRGLLQK